MAPRTLQVSEKQKTAYSPISSLQETVETIQGDALQYALTHLPAAVQESALEELLQQPRFFEYFKFGLADYTAGTIAAHDEYVQEIYYFDPYLNPDAQTETDLPLDVSVNLLVVVKSKTAALQSFVDALDRALTQQIRDLPSTQLAGLNSILNAIMISEEDIAHGRGYAALLSSLFNKPRRVWPRS
jgi:hypothetical protein